MKQTDSLLSELYSIFHQTNKHFFNSQLELPVITIQSQAVIKGDSLGWFTTGKVWRNDNESRNEINITAEYLNRPIDEIFGTLLHEMVHLYCHQNDIKDTSRQERYHNKAFKKECESRGLSVSYDSGFGWAYTSLDNKGRAFFDALHYNIYAFGFYRVASAPRKKSTASKSKSFTYRCSCCDATVKSKTSVKIRCEECDKLFECDD